MTKIYLCAPYTHESHFTMFKRVELINKKAAELMDDGYIVFSPVSHSHYIADHTKADNLDHDFWLNQDLPFIEWADEVWVYMLPEWEKSKGIKRELQEAELRGKPVRFICDGVG